ncbi:hypothetical protein RIVM261_074600 [Rivularia sp. IAM M-261]|nr:hypothetical protein CAL7716_047810 [Calothrix sp. PCC 7716]GJD22504.1 hypothetical protein RIVM261_074600 [Rivularia sp. IAM M-261]
MNPSVAAFTPNHVSKLTYTVAVQQKAETEWTAQVLGSQELRADGNTREEALKHLKEQLTQQLAQTEIVQIEVPLPKSFNSILALAGKYKDDPDFDDVVAAIHEYRKQVDAATNDNDEVA